VAAGFLGVTTNPDIMPSRPLGSFVANDEIFNIRLGIMSGKNLGLREGIVLTERIVKDMVLRPKGHYSNPLIPIDVSENEPETLVLLK